MAVNDLLKNVLAGAESARAELSTRLERARFRGDRANELDVLIRLAAVEVAGGHVERALPYLDGADDLLANEIGDDLAAGRVHYIRGQALARLGRDGLASFRAASAHFLAAEARVDELRARLRIVELLQDRQEIEEAILELSKMIADLLGFGSDRGLMDCYRYRAGLHSMVARFDHAISDYDEAVAAAERLGEPDLTLRMRLERRALIPYSARDAESWDDWADLIAEASARGNDQALGDIRLQQAATALRADRFEDGLSLAQEAQQAALDAGQPVLYLMACMLVAEAREGLGDHAGVIEILLTCKASLERAYGREFAAPLLVVLDSLEPRWGPEIFQPALASYRAWAQARKAAEGDASSS